MKIRRRFCDFCGKYYVGQGKWFCSPKCRGKATRGKPIYKLRKYKNINCKYCGNIFKPIWKGNIFCSRDCYLKDVAIKPKKCLICGKEYICALSNKRKERSKYCSIECLNKSKFQGRYKKCDYYKCNTKVWITPYREKIQKKHFCSRKCFKRYMRIIVTGNKYYKKGRRAECECMDILNKKGYYTIRSRGSLGTFDVVALSKENIKLIQVKLTKDKNWKMSMFKKDINRIKRTEVPDFCLKEFWVKVLYKGWTIINID